MHTDSSRPAARHDQIRQIATRWLVVLLAGLSLGATALPAGVPLTNAPSRTSKGLSYFHDETPEKPWSMHVIKVDRFNSEYEFHTTAGGHSTAGLSTLLDQIKALPPEQIGRAHV